MKRSKREQRAFAIGGLKYIAASPAQEHGGFHPQTVEIAKEALRLIRQLEDESRVRQMRALAEKWNKSKGKT